MKRKTSRSVCVFLPTSSSDSLGSSVATTLVAMAAKKGRVVAWPTARRLPIPERPGYTGGCLCVAETAPMPGWKRAGP